ncbi:MAG: DUF4981 domain-containing protein, partial [Deltaproteobacteria bacterium]
NDPSRPVHYERAKSGKNTDFKDDMYAPAEGIRKYTKSDAVKPYIICEYMHALGNSNGGAKEYWDLFYEDNLAQGGFVWDWMDQGIRMPVPTAFKKNIGKGPVKDTFFAYGGFFEKPEGVYNDGNFCMNGLIDSEQVPHPATYAHKYLQRFVHVIPVDLKAGKVKVKNWFDHSVIEDKVSGHWKIEAHGKTVANGDISGLGIAPHAEKILSLELPEMAVEPGKEYFLTLEFRAKKDYHPLVNEGHLLAWDQFKMPVETPAVLPKVNGSVKVEESARTVTVNGDGFEVMFDKKSGTLSSMKANGRELVVAGGLPELSRAQNDNERRQRPRVFHTALDTTGVKAVVESIKVKKLAGAVQITIQKLLPNVRGGFA